jgi:hypothetical protein
MCLNLFLIELIVVMLSGPARAQQPVKIFYQADKVIR